VEKVDLFSNPASAAARSQALQLRLQFAKAKVFLHLEEPQVKNIVSLVLPSLFERYLFFKQTKKKKKKDANKLGLLGFPYIGSGRH
jgi:hypothetical protein